MELKSLLEEKQKEALREGLTLINVERDEATGKAKLDFFDEENVYVYSVNISSKKYESDQNKGVGAWVDDEEKMAKTEEFCNEYLNCNFANIEEKKGEKFNVYVYDEFASLKPTLFLKRFDLEDKGKMIKVKIAEFAEDTKGIHVRVIYKNEIYEKCFTFGSFIEHMDKFVVNPIMKKKQIKKFEDTFKITYGDEEAMNNLIGSEVFAEIKVAFGTKAYIDFKNMDDEE